MERNFANIDVRAQQLEREVGQLLGDLKHEQSKVEEVRSELNAVTQQNAELLAELEQLRNNVTLYNDEKLVCFYFMKFSAGSLSFRLCFRAGRITSLALLSCLHRILLQRNA